LTTLAGLLTIECTGFSLNPNLTVHTTINLYLYNGLIHSVGYTNFGSWDPGIVQVASENGLLQFYFSNKTTDLGMSINVFIAGNNYPVPTSYMEGWSRHDSLPNSDNLVTVSKMPIQTDITGTGTTNLTNLTVSGSASINNDLTVSGTSTLNTLNVSNLTTVSGSAVTSANTPNTLVKRDENGNFVANNITGNILTLGKTHYHVYQFLGWHLTHGCLITTNINISTHEAFFVWHIKGQVYEKNESINIYLTTVLHSDYIQHAGFVNLGSWKPTSIQLARDSNDLLQLFLENNEDAIFLDIDLINYYANNFSNDDLSHWNHADALPSSTGSLVASEKNIFTDITGTGTTNLHDLTVSGSASIAGDLTVDGNITGNGLNSSMVLHLDDAEYSTTSTASAVTKNFRFVQSAQNPVSTLKAYVSAWNATSSAITTVSVDVDGQSTQTATTSATTETMLSLDPITCPSSNGIHTINLALSTSNASYSAHTKLWQVYQS